MLHYGYLRPLDMLADIVLEGSSRLNLWGQLIRDVHGLGLAVLSG
jgi:hypothetical protein